MAKSRQRPYSRPETPDRHLLVDGFNVIHAVIELRQCMKANLDFACSRLVDKVRIIHDVENLAATVVFDGKGTTLQIEKPCNQPSFSVVYAPAGVTADGIIEQIVRSSADPAYVTVASRDNLVAESVRAAGGVCIFPEDLMDWISRCESQRSRQLSRLRSNTRKIHDDPWKALDGL